jgi:hypothetical protein
MSTTNSNWCQAPEHLLEQDGGLDLGPGRVAASEKRDTEYGIASLVWSG